EDSEVEVDLGEIAEYVDNEEINLHFGGYEYEFVDEVLPSQKCPVCLLPMKDPVQTKGCGHRFCRACSLSVCRKQHRTGESDFFSQSRRFGNSFPHEDIYCKRFPLVCENNCGHDEIPREEMASHVSEKCLMTVVLCPYSEAGCPFEHTLPTPRSGQYLTHAHSHITPAVAAMDSGFVLAKDETAFRGCHYQGDMAVRMRKDKRAYLEDHLEVSADGHLEMAWNSLILAKKEISTMKDKFYEVQEVNQEMKESVAECRSELRELSAAVNKLVKENVGQKKFNQVITEKIKIVEAKIPQKMTPEAYRFQVPESMRRSPRTGLGNTVTGGLTSGDRIKLQKDALDTQRKFLQSYTRPSLNNTDKAESFRPRVGL
ncbi:unnamed protein product, partial [Porites evermanni]